MFWEGDKVSVLVKDIEMPKDCRECCMAEYHINTGKTWCKPADGLLADTYRPIMYDGRPDWCPLVELPEKHGRLIDADKLKEEFPKDTDWAYPVNTNQYVCETIDEANTVIEAEGE